MNIPMQSSVVVRFAPSPTGYLHVGGARTAIFNWLFARQNNGKFILRIEDTDQERSSADTIQGILDGLRWLGLEWDEGPYYQSRFVQAHLQAAETLLQAGQAYKCFCTKEVLDQKRETARYSQRTYMYDGTCRDLPADEVRRREDEGLPFTVRLKVPRDESAVSFEDVVYGHIEKRCRDIEDFIIVRSNGRPLYVLSNAVDDIRDGVTHIIRGQDGLANTPKQILIYRALGAPLPEFVHMSLALDPQKAKISKRRHGESVAVHFYKERGFLPWALVNFLVLLGWSTSDSRAIFSKEELLEAFSLKGINRNNPIFNIRQDDSRFFTDPKALNINAHYLRTLPVEEIVPYVVELLKKESLMQPEFLAERKEWFYRVIDTIRGRFQVLTDFVTYGRAYFSDEFTMDHQALEKELLKHNALKTFLPLLGECLDRLTSFEGKALEKAIVETARENDVKTGVAANAMRVVLTGQKVGPDFLAMLQLLGRKTVVKRLKAADRLFESTV